MLGGCLGADAEEMQVGVAECGAASCRWGSEARVTRVGVSWEYRWMLYQWHSRYTRGRLGAEGTAITGGAVLVVGTGDLPAVHLADAAKGEGLWVEGKVGLPPVAHQVWGVGKVRACNELLSGTLQPEVNLLQEVGAH